LITDFESCKDRVTLNFAAEVVYIYTMRDNSQVLDNLVNNLNYYIQ
jgi:hypothetical protein